VRFEPLRPPATEAEAIAAQDRLRPQVSHEGPIPSPLRWIAGLDVAYATDDSRVAGAVTVLDADTLDVIETATVLRPVEFPYIPGLLAFREIPALLDCLAKLTHVPDVLVCDGYGRAHPRRFGLACHLGVLTDLPTFGVAKTAFIGTFTTPATPRGSHSDLIDSDAPITTSPPPANRAPTTDSAPSSDGHAGSVPSDARTFPAVRAPSTYFASSDGPDIIGRVLRTQPATKPVFVSTGHRISLDAATELTLRLTPKYRLPETTRQADQASRRALAAAR
jgi:deoxyribonuclease V